MDTNTVRITPPPETNLIIGQAHFIKTVEDLYEALVGACPGIEFGLAFCEASGPCLVRSEGNDSALREAAEQHALAIGAGHSFVILIRKAFPINVLAAIRACPEVVTIYCATANAVQVLTQGNAEGRAVIGVIDGSGPRGIEDDAARKERHDFLRRINYKR